MECFNSKVAGCDSSLKKILSRSFLMTFVKFFRIAFLQGTYEWLHSFQVNWEILHLILFIQKLFGKLQHDTVQIKISSELK